MSLPTGQQRALDQIEIALAHDHPALGPLFAAFTRVVGQQPMPVTERVTGRPRPAWQRRMWPTVAGVVGLALLTVALFTLSLTLPNRPACTGTVVSIAAGTQTLPPGSQAACTTRPTEPTKTRLAGAVASHAH
jgi:Protein of unknown function (DUF3040)